MWFWQLGVRAYGDDGERLAALEVQIAELTVVSESQSEAINELSAAVAELSRQRAEGQDSEEIASEIDKITAELARLEAENRWDRSGDASRGLCRAELVAGWSVL